MYRSKRSIFNLICRSNGLNLDYSSNKNQLQILRSVFIEREYADYFPFYENATILDVGAHFGYFSIFASKNLSDHSRIIAVEPETNNYRNLKENISFNGCNNITAIKLAIGGYEGKATLYRSSTPNHSLLSTYKLLDQKPTEEETEVTTISWLMSHFQLKEIDFLKLDCEGSEYDILEQIDKDVLSRIKVISMEFHDLKIPGKTGNYLAAGLERKSFHVVKFKYMPSWHGLNYGRLIAVNRP